MRWDLRIDGCDDGQDSFIPQTIGLLFVAARTDDVTLAVIHDSVPELDCQWAAAAQDPKALQIALARGTAATGPARLPSVSASQAGGKLAFLEGREHRIDHRHTQGLLQLLEHAEFAGAA